jgi:hypothetical protein
MRTLNYPILPLPEFLVYWHFALRMDCERRRLWRSGSSRPPSPPPYSFSQALRHMCSLCGKPRSSSYQKRHPIAPGQTPEPGVCSRPRCAKAVADMLLAKSPCSGVVVHEIHHYYHISTDAEAPLATKSAELPSPTKCVEAPSPTKSTEAPSATKGAAELPGKSSLTGRTELPGDYKYVEGYGPRNPCPTQEESPPRVNILNKPALQRWQF